MSDRLIFAYLLPHAGGYALIETGPQKTASRLWEALQTYLSPDKPLTDIVVTHIHLDHSGAAGWLQQKTGATIHVHARGMKHLIDPAKIIAGSRGVFGKAFDLLWDEPLAAVGEVVGLADGDSIRLQDRTLQVIETPGHAWHHAAFYDADTATAFTGDVAGVRYGGPMSVRLPSVPTDFDESAWRKSFSRLSALKIENLALTHGGVFGEASEHLAEARRFLDETLACFEIAGDRASIETRVRDLWQRRLAAETNPNALAGKYEMIMATPLCIRGIAMAREKAGAP